MIHLARNDFELASAIAAAKAGDIIECAGEFGALMIDGSQYNKIIAGSTTLRDSAPALSGPVMIRSADIDEPATFPKIDVRQSDYWRFIGLEVSPGYQPNTFTAMDLDGYEIQAVNCKISYGYPTGWTPADWLARAGNGIIMRGPRGLIQNCDIKTVSTGFQFVGNAAEGVAQWNCVNWFARDGCRALVDGVTLEFNTIAYAVKVDANHDDCFQAWEEGKGQAGQGGVIRNITLRGNVFDGQLDHSDPLSAAPHGISGFKTKAIGWLIENNTVLLDTWNGIVLDEAEDCRIWGNKVVVPDPESDVFGSIRITGDASNEVANNICDRLVLSPEIQARDNVQLKP